MADGILNPIQQLEADFDFDVYTKQEVDALLDEKADKVDTYTKTETDALLDDKADADAVYTKTETDNLLSAKADADSVYTKAEIDTKIPSSVGSAVKPTYVNNGVITECTYELNKTVPANAVFTDTTYSAGNGLQLSSGTFSAKAHTNVTVDGNGISVVGNGTVASADSGLINGNTAYNELRPTLDGTWVKNAQTTGVNLQKLEGGIEYLYALLSKQYSQLKKYVNGNYYDYDTDTDSKYTKTVPNGAMPYASLDSIGGKTLVWNQLVDVGTTTVSTISGHKYYTLIDGTASIVTSSGSAITIVDDTADMVCDLTLMYGGGNEPATVEEFESVFPAPYYAYNQGSLLSAGVTEVVSKDADNTTIDTYNIPADIQALSGYGWSAGSVYNYVDFDRKVFVQNVGSVDLGTLTWTSMATDSGGKLRYVSSYLVGTIKNGTANVPADFIVCNKYFASGDTYHRSEGLQVGSDGKIYIYDSTKDNLSGADFTTAMSGTDLNYELATPIETDISAYLTDDNLISVESGGTLTFPNSNGDDYRIAVPSSETFMIDLQEAI